MYASIFVAISIITLLIFEIKIFDRGKLNKNYYRVYLPLLIFLPFLNQNLVSVFPFLVLLIINLFRIQKEIKPKKEPTTYGTISKKTNNKITKRLLNIIQSKKTNLCVSADVNTKSELLKLANEVGPFICILKTHIDTISDFDEDLVKSLKQLSLKHNFLIFEDRKFADIGHIAKRQFINPPFNISQWADLITVHTIAGSSSIEALKNDAINNKVGLIVVAQMSTKDTLTNSDYTNKAIQIAEKNRDLVVGVVSQTKRSDSEDILMLTPGINIHESCDGMGQVYNTPQNAIETRGVDIIIVGRGVYTSNNPEKIVSKYREIGWNSYLKRISNAESTNNWTFYFTIVINILILYIQLGMMLRNYLIFGI